jgi:hypothetical protein
LNAQREIRVLDVNQREIFRIPDGGCIVVTREGVDYKMRCRVIEGDMFQEDRMIFIGSDFAEKMAALGAAFAPAENL